MSRRVFASPEAVSPVHEYYNRGRVVDEELYDIHCAAGTIVNKISGVELYKVKFHEDRHVDADGNFLPPGHLRIVLGGEYLHRPSDRHVPLFAAVVSGLEEYMQHPADLSAFKELR